MPDIEKRKRRLFALLYRDDQGNQRSLWYPSRKNAERAALELKRESRVEEVRV
jgi:hypothetical protein